MHLNQFREPDRRYQYSITEMKLCFLTFVVLCFFCQDISAATVENEDDDPSFEMLSYIRKKTYIPVKRSICGGHFFADKGVIESPNFPNNYPDYMNCVWYLSVPERSRIRLTFSDFEMESSDTCSYDRLEVRDGPSDSSALLKKLCGSSPPSPIQSSQNMLTLKSFSDGSVSKKGFRAEYEKVVDCGGELNSEEGNVTTPHYPNKYPELSDCVWVITVPKQYQVMLRFRSFQLEDSPACTADFVNIRDGPDLSSRVLGWFCGSGVTREIRSSRNSMTIRFKSNQGLNFRGFSAQYMKVRLSTEQKVTSMGIRSIPGLLSFGIMILFALK